MAISYTQGDSYDITTQVLQEFRTANDLRSAVLVLERFSLQEHLGAFQALTSQADNKYYHSQRHAYVMVLNCYEGAVYDGSLHSDDLRALLAAALFHDVNHSLGVHSDKVNIDKACATLTWVNNALASPARLTPRQLAGALELIRATQWPIGDVPEDNAQRIIRDADLMMAYLPNDKRAPLFHGLFREVNLRKPVSVESFRAGQMVFAAGVKWNTVWAQKKAEALGWMQCSVDACDDLEKLVNAGEFVM